MHLREWKRCRGSNPNNSKTKKNIGHHPFKEVQKENLNVKILQQKKKIYVPSMHFISIEFDETKIIPQHPHSQLSAIELYK